MIRRPRRRGPGEGLPGPEEARRRLAAYGLTPARRRGQHFLIDSPRLHQIVAAASITPGQTVVEIGPGLGVLTRALARTGARVIAVEIDPALARVLEVEAPTWGDVRIVQADVLDLDVGEVLREFGRTEGYKLVANLPYAITSPVLRRFLGGGTPPDAVVVMVQFEVGQRLAARPGDWAYLSVLTRLYGEPELLFRVPPSAFYPPPKVESAVVRVVRHAVPPVNVDGVQRFLEFVLTGFAHPRKQLHNALSRSLWFREGEAATVLRRLGIDPTRRAQTLSLEEWARLYAEVGGRLP